MPFRLFCIFPHPDDETFLMGGTIATASAAGHEVSLYTLTRGERSRNGDLLGLTPEEVGRRREKEVEQAAHLLGVRRLFQGDYPDGGLRDLDPRTIERDISEKIRQVRPHVLCTFDVQGGSVHPDHIVMHHVVKRTFLELRDEIGELQRLCFCVLPARRVANWPRKIHGASDDRIQAVIDVSAMREVEERALAVHRTVYRDVEEHNYDGWMLWEQEYFHFFQEWPDQPLSCLFEGLRP